MENRPSLRLWLMLVCGTMLYFFVLFWRSAIPAPIFDLLLADIGDKASVAMLGSMFMYAYGVTQLVAGLLVDKFGSRRVMLCGGFLMCLGAGMFTYASTLTGYYSARLLSGVGGGVIYLCLIKDAMLFPRQWYGMLIGVIVTIGFLGGIVANSPFVLLVHSSYNDFDIILSYATYVMFFFYLCWIMIVIELPRTPINKNVSFNYRPYLQVMKKGANWMIFLFNALNFALFCVLQTVIGHKFLHDVVNMNLSSASAVFTATAAMTAVSGVLFQVICRISGEKRSQICRFIGYLTVLIFLCLWAMMLTKTIIPSMVVVLFLILAFTMNSMVVVVPLLRSINTDETTGTAVGILNFLNFIFVAIFGQLAGNLMKSFSDFNSDNAFLKFFSIMAVLSIIELVCALRIKE